MSLSDRADAQRMIDLQINFLLNQDKLDATLGGMSALQVGLEYIQKQEEAEAAFLAQQFAIENERINQINEKIAAYNNFQATLQNLIAEEQAWTAAQQASANAEEAWTQSKLKQTDAIEAAISADDAWNAVAKEQQDIQDGYTAMLNATAAAEAKAADELQRYIGIMQEASVVQRQSIADQADLNNAFAANPPSDGAGSTDDGSGGSGSATGGFAVAHGIRAASGLGRLAGLGPGATGAFTGAADVIYLQTALAKLGDVVPTLNSALENSGGLVGSFADDLTSIGAPMSGLIAGALTLGPALIALGGAVVILKAQLAEGEKGTQAGIAQLDAYYKTIEDKSKTTATVTADMADQDSKLADAQQHLKEVQDAQIAALADPAGKGDVVGVAKVAASDSMAALKKDAEDTEKSIKALTAARDADQASLNDGSLKAHDAADQAKKDTANLLDGADKITTLHRQEVTDLQGTADAIQKRRDGLEGEREGLLENIQILNASGDTSDAVTKKIGELQSSLALLQSRLLNIDDNLPDIKAREAAAKAESKAIEAANRANAEHEALIKKITAATEAYDKAMQSIMDNLTNSINDAQTKERYAELQYTPGSLQDTAQRTDIALKEQRDVSKIEEDTANKIVDIRTKLGETEATLVTDYNRQIFDDQIKYQDSLEKLQVDAQRQSQQDAISHAQKIADINENLARNELQDVADRNFQKLATDMQSAADQRSKTDEQYTAQEQALQRHLANQESDLARSLAEQEAKQQLDEGRKIADAETAADNQIAQENTTEKRKIAALKDSEQQQLDDLTRHELDKISLLRQNYVQEFTMLQIQANNRENIAAATEQQIVSQVDAILAAGTNAFIDDLSRLNAMANGSSGGSSAPSPSSQYFQLNPQSNAVPSAPTQSASQTFDPVTAVNTIVSTVVSGLQQGLGNLFAP